MALQALNIVNSEGKVRAVVSVENGTCVVTPDEYQWVLDLYVPGDKTPQDGSDFIEGLAVTIRSPQGLHTEEVSPGVSLISKASAFLRGERT